MQLQSIPTELGVQMTTSTELDLHEPRKLRRTTLRHETPHLVEKIKNEKNQQNPISTVTGKEKRKLNLKL
jgi:hypothetical protein